MAVDGHEGVKVRMNLQRVVLSEPIQHTLPAVKPDAFSDHPGSTNPRQVFQPDQPKQPGATRTARVCD
jgi:hypothetical protein